MEVNSTAIHFLLTFVHPLFGQVPYVKFMLEFRMVEKNNLIHTVKNEKKRIIIILLF